MLIKIENGKPVGNPVLEDNLRLLYPNVSFPLVMTTSDVEPFGFGLYEFSPEPQLTQWQKAVEVDPVQNGDGIWVQTWIVEPLTPSEKAQKESEMKAANKRIAEASLRDSDWSVLPDVALQNKAEWESYRASLREIAINPPIEVGAWPAPPKTIWANA